jgi:glucosamine-6-phosphate deaminase
MSAASRVSPHTFVLPLADPAAVGALAAELLVNRLAARPCRVLLPTGTTPLPFYSALRERAAAGRIVPGRCEVLQLGEYVEPPAGRSETCRAYLERELPAPALRLAETFDEPGRYQEVVDAREIDLAVLGLGPDGRVGFEPPGAGANSSVRVVPLAGSASALTVGMRTLLEARECLLLVTGQSKAEVLLAALTGAPRAGLPASLLRLHPRFTVLCDEEAGSRLGPTSGSGSDRVLVVLGHRDPGSRAHRASHQSFSRLRTAARIARTSPVRATVLTGFTSTGGLSEAEQMAEEWWVRGVPALLEVAGRDTIENATRSLPLVAALGDVRQVTVVTSAWHLRARRAFRNYRRAGFDVAMAYDWSEGPWLRMLARELYLMARAAARRCRPNPERPG